MSNNMPKRIIGALRNYQKLVSKELRIRKNERSKFFLEAKEHFEEQGASHPGSLEDYRQLLYNHRFDYNEYMRYKLYSLSKSEREDVISSFEMNTIYRKFVDNKIRRTFTDKALCLQLFGKWVHRKWCVAKDISYEQFNELVSNNDCIYKPLKGECGAGIFFTKKDEEKDNKSLYEKCVNKNYLIEECIHNCDEIAQFHPSSLNTIRVTTMQNGKDCRFIGAALRMGMGGSSIDNVSAGGISVPIELTTGTINMNGFDARGNEYEKHPTTNKVFSGTIIPHWDKLLQMCKEASTIVPEAYFTGWDVCILPSGEIEFIEGNSAPNIRVLQYTPGYSKKSIVKQAGEELLNINLLKLISVWSKSYRKYN